MKTSLLLYLIELSLLVRKAGCTNTPLLPYDPETTSDCADWFNNDDDKTCEWVRDYFRATPEEFSRWNPSVGLDCKPWYNWNSYCVITWTKVNETQTTTTSSTTTRSPTSAAPTLGPSPTAWTDMGCYVEDPAMPLLDLNASLSGDPSLSVPKCWQTDMLPPVLPVRRSPERQPVLVWVLRRRRVGCEPDELQFTVHRCTQHLLRRPGAPSDLQGGAERAFHHGCRCCCCDQHSCVWREA